MKGQVLLRDPLCDTANRWFLGSLFDRECQRIDELLQGRLVPTAIDGPPSRLARCCASDIVA